MLDVSCSHQMSGLAQRVAFCLALLHQLQAARAAAEDARATARKDAEASLRAAPEQKESEVEVAKRRAVEDADRRICEMQRDCEQSKWQTARLMSDQLLAAESALKQVGGG